MWNIPFISYWYIHGKPDVIYSTLLKHENNLKGKINPHSMCTNPYWCSTEHSQCSGYLEYEKIRERRFKSDHNVKEVILYENLSFIAAVNEKWT